MHFYYKLLCPRRDFLLCVGENLHPKRAPVERRFSKMLLTLALSVCVIYYLINVLSVVFIASGNEYCAKSK